MSSITVIYVHQRERRSKCSVEPLRRCAGFLFLTYPTSALPDLAGYVRLGVDGPELSSADAEKGLFVIDSTWRLAPKMEAKVKDLPVRALRGWTTAYPRVSKSRQDPADGLATVEAIFAAHHVLGRPTEDLLNEYHWRDEFLRLNVSKLLANR